MNASSESLAPSHNFIISGIQGSGKGTQARLLGERVGMIHIGTGALCRWHLANKTTYGKELRAINQGTFAADELMISLVERRLVIHDDNYPFLLDGFPRNRAQADYLFSKYKFGAVIHLELAEEYALQRAMGRMDGKQVRADDNEEALKMRFNLYHEHTKPLLEYYRQKGILHFIDGMGPIETVHKRIVHSLMSKNLIPHYTQPHTRSFPTIERGGD